MCPFLIEKNLATHSNDIWRSGDLLQRCLMGTLGLGEGAAGPAIAPGIRWAVWSGHGQGLLVAGNPWHARCSSGTGLRVGQWVCLPTHHLCKGQTSVHWASVPCGLFSFPIPPSVVTGSGLMFSYCHSFLQLEHWEGSYG